MRNRRLTVFPKVDGPSGRGLRQPPGLSPLGCQGSARDRLRLPDGLRAPPRELYSTALCVSRMGYASQPKLASSLHNKRPSFYSADRLGRWAPGGAILYAAFRRRPPLVAGATTFPPALLVGLWVLRFALHDTKRSVEQPILPPA